MKIKRVDPFIMQALEDLETALSKHDMKLSASGESDSGLFITVNGVTIEVPLNDDYEVSWKEVRKVYDE